VKQLIPEKQDPVVERKSKMSSLATALIETIKTESHKSGHDFTIHELMDVLIKIQHSYNKRFLDADHAQMNQNPDKG
jgi:hypothetical protein